MLVNCVAYQEGRRLGDIPPREISDHLARPGTFVWVAIKDPQPAEMAEMQAEFDLHPLAVEDSLKGHQRPKIEEYGDSLFTVMQVPQLRNGEMVVGELHVFVGPNYVLSVRRDIAPGFTAVRQRAESEPELLKVGAGFVFYALMDDVADRYFPLVDALEMRLEEIEKRIFETHEHRRIIESLYDLKYQLMVMRHAVEPLLEVIHKLYGGRVPQVCRGVQDYFRDIYDHLLRVSQQLDGLRDMVVTALSVDLSISTMETTEITKRLAAYAALVAVPTLIAGVYGMNFKHMPELSWTFGYPLAIGLMVVIDLFLLRRFRKIGWL